MTIPDQLYFRRLSKVLSILHHGSIGRVQKKECYFKLLYPLFLDFLLLFIIKFVFLAFSFLFFEIIFLQQKINQSETGTGVQKLSVKLIFLKNSLLFLTASRM